MPHDIFISSSRRDNEQGRITQFVERIKQDLKEGRSMKDEG